jgi:hypothetical protein
MCNYPPVRAQTPLTGRTLSKPSAMLRRGPWSRGKTLASAGPLFVLTLAALLVQAQPAADAVSNGPLSILPTNSPGTTAPRSKLDYTLRPGQTVPDSLSLSNSSSEDHQVELYAADAYNIPSGGGFALRAPGDPKVGVGAWVRLSTSRVTLAPRSTATVPLSISVPATASPGDHAGGIVALDVTPTTERRNGVSILVRQGVAFRVYVRVTGPLRPGLRVEDLRVLPSAPPLSWATGSSHASTSLQVLNTGNVVLNSVVTATATDALGGTVKRFAPVHLDALLPGSQAAITLPEWDGLPVFGPTVTVHASVSSPPLVSSATTSFTLVPWLLVALVGILLLGGICALTWSVLLYLGRRPKRRAPIDGGEAPAPASRGRD